MTYKLTHLKIAVHAENESPVFGESVVHIAIEDDAAGPFLSISNPLATHPERGPGFATFDPKQWQSICDADSILMLEIDKINDLEAQNARRPTDAYNQD